MAHKPNWIRDEDGFLFDENQPDSDQFSGTTEEWVALLADEGILPPSEKG